MEGLCIFDFTIFGESTKMCFYISSADRVKKVIPTQCFEVLQFLLPLVDDFVDGFALFNFLAYPAVTYQTIKIIIQKFKILRLHLMTSFYDRHPSFDTSVP